MSRSRRTRTSIAAAGAIVLALPAAAHAAAPSLVTGGTTTIVPSGPVARTLEAADVRVLPLGTAKAAGRGVAVPVTDGLAGRVTVLEHAATDGVLLRGAGDDVRLTDLRVRLGRTSRVTGRIDGAKASTLFTLKASKLYPGASASTLRRTKISWRMTAATARAVRKALELRRLDAGTFGRATMAAELAAPGSSAPTPTPAPPAPTPLAPGQAAPPVASTVVSGVADWGVRASFRNYISGFAAGKVVASDGATINADGTYRYAAPTGTVVRATGAVDVAFRGTVYFEGHGAGEDAALRLWVRNPHVVVAPGATTGTLRADVSSKSLSSGTVVDYPNVAFADLDLTGGTRTATDATVTWSAVPATLTAAGAEAFAGFYPAGDPLDPVSFVVNTR